MHETKITNVHVDITNYNHFLSFVKKYSKHTPLNRMMKKNELNGIIEFLCSSQSSYVTGATFVIDGGWTCW